jgi:hypothetical protein
MPRGLDQPLDPTGGDPGQVGLGDHRDQGAFRPSPRTHLYLEGAVDCEAFGGFLV